MGHAWLERSMRREPAEAFWNPQYSVVMGRRFTIGVSGLDARRALLARLCAGKQMQSVLSGSQCECFNCLH